MNTSAASVQGLVGCTPEYGLHNDLCVASVSPWRTILAGTLGLAAVVVWWTVSRQEGRFARRPMSPDSVLLSADELEDQLYA